MPLTEKGFERPVYDDLLAAQEARAKILFGDNINTSAQTPLGKYIRLNVSDLDELYQTLEKVYYSRFPNTATGVSLERLGPFAGITRNPATFARHLIRIYGVAGETVSTGFVVSTVNQSVLFYTIEDAKIGDDGTVEVFVDCETAGTVGNLTPGTLTYIVRPSADVDYVEHLELVIVGEEEESDFEFRKRWVNALSGAGTGMVDAIRGNILRVPYVGGVTILENDSDKVKNGLPPHSFQCFVLAPESQNEVIARAIFEKKPIGIQPVGEIEVLVQDESGNDYSICFTRSNQKDIYVRATIRVNAYFATDGKEQIKANIVSTIDQLANGNTLYISSLYKCFHDIDGVESVPTLMLSTDGANYSAADISCASNEVARVSTDHIAITVLE